MKEIIFTFSMLFASFSFSENVRRISLGHYDPQQLEFSQIKKDRLQIYLISFRNGAGVFTRAVPADYFRKIKVEFDDWARQMSPKKLPLLQPACRESIEVFMQNKQEELCHDLLSADSKKKFQNWFRENKQIAQLTYGGRAPASKRK